MRSIFRGDTEKCSTGISRLQVQFINYNNDNDNNDNNNNNDDNDDNNNNDDDSSSSNLVLVQPLNCFFFKLV